MTNYGGIYTAAIDCAPRCERNNDPRRVLLSSSQPLITWLGVCFPLSTGDPAGGDSFEDSLNKIVCKQAVVRRVVEEEAMTPLLDRYAWVDGRPLSSVDGSEPELHYWELPQGCTKFYDEPELKRRFAKNFCTDADSPGILYRSLHSHLEAAMRCDKETDQRLIRGDHYFVLPAVWQLLESLEGRHFTLVIRTFGTDLEAVADALTAFAERHEGTPLQSLKLSKENMYALRRDGESCSMTPLSGGGERLDERAAIALIERDDQPVRCIGISDDYPSWKAAGFKPSAGKPCWITPSARHVFFDDNIHNDPNKSIVNVRWLQPSGGIVSLNGNVTCQLHGLVLFRVPTLEAILHHDWFARQVTKVEAVLDNYLGLIRKNSSCQSEDADISAWFPWWIQASGNLHLLPLGLLQQTTAGTNTG